VRLSKRTRSRESKKQKQFAKQYGAALRKVIAMTRNASTDLRVPPPAFQVSAPQLGIDEEVFDQEHLLRHLKLLYTICESWEKAKLGKPKPDAYEKRQRRVESNPCAGVHPHSRAACRRRYARRQVVARGLEIVLTQNRGVPADGCCGGRGALAQQDRCGVVP
jgi:hypothetical protein